jgi:hypothetical protein
MAGVDHIQTFIPPESSRFPRLGNWRCSRFPAHPIGGGKNGEFGLAITIKNDSRLYGRISPIERSLNARN